MRSSTVWAVLGKSRASQHMQSPADFTKSHTHASRVARRAMALEGPLGGRWLGLGESLPGLIQGRLSPQGKRKYRASAARPAPPRCFGPKPWGDLVVWPPTDRSRTARAASETNGHSRAQRHRTTVRPFGTLTLISRSKSAPKASRGHFGDLLGPCWRLLGPR